MTGVQSLGQEDPRRRKWHPIPVFLPGKSHGQRSLAGYVHGVTKSQTRLHIHSDYRLITDQPVLGRRGDWAGWTSPATSAKVLSTQRKEERMQDVLGKPEVPPSPPYSLQTGKSPTSTAFSF